MIEQKGRLFIYSGPSGVGKGTLLAPLIREGYVTLSVSATTRAPRAGERDGVEYHFVSREEFERMIAAGEMLEYTEYSGNYYGTPRRFVERALEDGLNLVLEIETEGGQNVARLCPEAVRIFVMPPSLETLRERLRGRGTETEEVIERRLGEARREIAAAVNYDFIIVNDDVFLAREQLASAIEAGSALRRLHENTIREVLESC